MQFPYHISPIVTILPLSLLSHYAGMPNEKGIQHGICLNKAVIKHVSEDWRARIGDRILLILEEVGLN